MKKFITNIKYLIPDSKRERIPFFFCISIINSLLDFVSIAFLTPFILIIINKNKVDEFIQLYFDINYTQKHIFIALAILIIFYFFKNIIQTKIISKQSKYLYAIGSEISKKLAHSFSYGNYQNFYQTDKGQLIRDLHRLPIIFVTNILLPIFNLSSEIIILLMIIFGGLYLNPLITIIAIIFVISSTFLLLFFRKNKTNYFNTIIASSYKKTLNHLMNILNGFVEIKSSKSEDNFIENFYRSNKQHNKTLAELSTFKQNNIRYLEILTIGFIALATVYTLLYPRSFNDMVLVSFYASAIIKIIPSFNRINNAYIDLKSNKHAVDILASYTPVHINKEIIAVFDNTILLQNINYKYPNKDFIIHNCNLKIKKKDFIAVTGKSGCGKTTLLHLISGMLPITSGTIFIDQTKVLKSDFFPFAYMLSQQSFIFQGTLLENIIMNKQKQIDYDYINMLIDIFELRDWFISLDNGFETVLNLDSKSISGGQKQRIALVRALYAKPKLLLLDEATNQLNEELELKIMKFLKNETIQNELTIVAVFHNKTLAELASKTYIFENNRLS